MWVAYECNLRKHVFSADTHDTHATHVAYVTHVTRVTLTHDMPPESFIRSAKAHDIVSEMQFWVVLQFCYCYC